MIRKGQKIGDGRYRATCPVCKQKFWCYKDMHQWTLDKTKGLGEDMYIMRVPSEKSNGDRNVKYYCSYHCMRVDDKKRMAKVKKRYAKLMWEAANLYDADGNRLTKRKRKKHEEAA